jgi:hypothetical protein
MSHLSQCRLQSFETGFCPTNESLRHACLKLSFAVAVRLQLNPLYDYAARNWEHHAGSASTEVEQLVVNFLESEAKVSGSSQAMATVKEYRSK